MTKEELLDLIETINKEADPYWSEFCQIISTQTREKMKTALIEKRKVKK